MSESALPVKARIAHLIRQKRLGTCIGCHQRQGLQEAWSEPETAHKHPSTGNSGRPASWSGQSKGLMRTHPSAGAADGTCTAAALFAGAANWKPPGPGACGAAGGGAASSTVSPPVSSSSAWQRRCGYQQLPSNSTHRGPQSGGRAAETHRPAAGCLAWRPPECRPYQKFPGRCSRGPA